MYYQITFTLDKRIRGRYEMPHTVKIKSKDFLDYMSEKNRNILMYFENKSFEQTVGNSTTKVVKFKQITINVSGDLIASTDFI